MTDLIERVMDKGVVVKLDLIIGMAGIPLIGISLHAAIAAIETMLQYGMMEDWDSRTRAVENGEAEWRQLALRPGEQIQAELYGSYHDTEGIWRVWRPGRLLLTDERLLLIRPVPRGAELGVDGIPVSAHLRAVVRGLRDDAGERPHITRTVQHRHINERAFCPHMGFLFDIRMMVPAIPVPSHPKTPGRGIADLRAHCNRTRRASSQACSGRVDEDEPK
jgi:hypothetical protein